MPKLLDSVLLKGTVILTLSGIMVRILGMLNRIILSRWIGAEGLGLFQLVLPVYGLMAAMVSFGLPGAMAKMIAERYALRDYPGREKIKKMAFKLVTALAFILILLYWTAVFLLGDVILPDTRISLPLKIAPFGFLFAAMSQILRSYFQGLSNMVPTAVSQLVEQSLRFSLGLLGVILLLPYGLEYAVTGIMLGVIAGEVFGFLSLLLLQKRDTAAGSLRHGTPNLSRHRSLRLLKEMLLLSFPLLIIRISGSLTHAAESFLIPSRLQEAGFSTTEAVSLFGQLSGMALPLLFLPTVLIFPLNSALVPYIARHKVLRQKESLNNIIILSLWGVLLLGVLSAFVLYYFSSQLTSFLYGDIDASCLVSLLAWAAPFAYIQFNGAAILHGLGRPGSAVANDFIGTLIALILIYYLTAVPAIGINGAVWGYGTGFIITTLLHSVLIHSTLKKL